MPTPFGIGRVARTEVLLTPSYVYLPIHTGALSLSNSPSRNDGRLHQLLPMALPLALGPVLCAARAQMSTPVGIGRVARTGVLLTPFRLPWFALLSASFSCRHQLLPMALPLLAVALSEDSVGVHATGSVE
jgi:hypothetical protein